MTPPTPLRRGENKLCDLVGQLPLRSSANTPPSTVAHGPHVPTLFW